MYWGNAMQSSELEYDCWLDKQIELLRHEEFERLDVKNLIEELEALRRAESAVKSLAYKSFYEVNAAVHDRATGIKDPAQSVTRKGMLASDKPRPFRSPRHSRFHG